MNFTFLSDSAYGIKGYSWENSGIQGRIKQSHEDFIVQEIDYHTGKPIPLYPDQFETEMGGGLYFCCRVWRQGMDNSKMIKLISRHFKVPEDAISSAGVKDANATITQLISIFEPKKVPTDPQYIDPGLIIDGFHYRRKRIFPGAHLGNKFTINIRETNDLSQDDLDDFLDKMKAGTPNYFGYQRFGGIRPITAQFGRMLVNKKYQDAANIYLGGHSEIDEENSFRRNWESSKDPETVILNSSLPIPFLEYKILKHLERRPADFRGAIATLPDFLINIAKSAFTSILFNEYLSLRGNGLTINKGERRINRDGKVNVEIALPSQHWEKPLNPIWQEVFTEYDLDLKELKTIKHTSRLLRLYPEGLQYDIVNKNTLSVVFSLVPGSYATIVLRELMKSDIINYF